tara:strand:+ start:137 stop:520 length:384 start_codon:yes stop_codon:yes gene_type:complete
LAYKIRNHNMAIIFNGTGNQNGQIPLPFNIESLVKDAVAQMIMNRMSLRSMNMIRYVEFFPTFTMCEQLNEKTMSSVFLKLKYSNDYTRIPVNEIEMSGATLIEFIDFLYEKGAKEIDPPGNILEII